MASQMVRINEADHATLMDLAKSSGQSMASTLSDAIRTLERERLLQATNAAYEELRKDPHAWDEELEERKLWDATLKDGLS